MSDISEEQFKKILSVYAMIAVAAIMICIPYMIIMTAGLSLMAMVWIFCYFYKFRSKSQPVPNRHFRYMIRTMWWSTLVAFVCVFLFGSIVYFNGDLSPVNAMIQQAERGVVPNDADIAVMNASFIQLNRDLILWTAIATLPLYPLYIIIRVLMGVQSIIKEGAGK